jgi:hypothetical protein
MSTSTNFSRFICVPDWEELNKKFEDRRSQLPVWDGSFDRGFRHTDGFTAVFMGSYTGGGGSWDSWIFEDEIYSYRGRGPIFKVETVVSPTNLIVEVVVTRNGFKASWDHLTEGEVIEITGKDFHHFERISYRPPLPKWKTTNLKICGTRDEALIELSEKGCVEGEIWSTVDGVKSVCIRRLMDQNHENSIGYHWITVGAETSIKSDQYGPATLTLIGIDEESNMFIFEVSKVSTILNIPTKNLEIGQRLSLSFQNLVMLLDKELDDDLIAGCLNST